MGIESDFFYFVNKKSLNHNVYPSQNLSLPENKQIENENIEEDEAFTGDHDTMLDTMEEVDIKSETIESKENYENVNENLQCEICDLKFPYFLLLKLHNFEHHKDSDIKVCPY